MTRINVGINPRRLTDEHLVAEHREIKRIPSVYEKRKGVKRPTPIPDKFCLGTGHVSFFTNKPTYTLDRYQWILLECKSRGFKALNYAQNWEVYKGDTNIVDYTPMVADVEAITERIINNLKNGKLTTYHYYGHKITIDQAINLLKTGKIE